MDQNHVACFPITLMQVDEIQRDHARVSGIRMDDAHRIETEALRDEPETVFGMRQHYFKNLAQVFEVEGCAGLTQIFEHAVQFLLPDHTLLVADAVEACRGKGFSPAQALALITQPVKALGDVVHVTVKQIPQQIFPCLVFCGRGCNQLLIGEVDYALSHIPTQYVAVKVHTAGRFFHPAHG